MPYSQMILGSNLSVFAEAIDTAFEQVRSLERGALSGGEPTVKPTGLLWNRTDYTVIGESILRWDGAAWTLLMDPEFAQINAGGTVAFAADQAMGTHKLTGLSAGSASGHSVRYEQVMLLSGANAMAADMAMGSHKITGLSDPTGAQHAMTLASLRRDQLGQFRVNLAAQVAQASDEAGTFNQVLGLDNSGVADYFTPRVLKIRLTGDVTDQSGGSPHGTIDKEYTIARWAGETTKVVDADVTVGSKHVRVEVTWKTTTPRGFWIYVIRNDNDAWQDVELVQFMAEAGINN